MKCCTVVTVSYLGKKFLYCALTSECLKHIKFWYIVGIQWISMAAVVEILNAQWNPKFEEIRVHWHNLLDWYIFLLSL